MYSIYVLTKRNDTNDYKSVKVYLLVTWLFFHLIA